MKAKKKTLFCFFGLLLFLTYSFALEAFAENANRIVYHANSPDSQIVIPKGYTLFTRSIDENSEELRRMNIAKDDLVTYLNAYGSEFLAVSPDGNMEVMLKLKKTGFGSNNLNSQSIDVVSSFAEGLQKGFGAKTYELVERDDITWVKLTYLQPVSDSSTPADIIRYTTVANGWDVYLWGSSYNGKLTQQNSIELQNMLDSFSFTKKTTSSYTKPKTSTSHSISKNKTDTSGTLFVLVLLLITFSLCITILIIAKRNLAKKHSIYKMKKCPCCKQSVPKESDFCHHCGEKV